MTSSPVTGIGWGRDKALSMSRTAGIAFCIEEILNFWEGKVLGVGGKLQQEPPMSYWVDIGNLVIDWNLEVRYSRRYFDKAPQAARA